MAVQSDLQGFETRLTSGALELGMPLTPDQTRLLTAHARELLLWNRKMNLTAIRTPQAVAEKHFIDALTISGFVTQEKRIMDMGTGGGFPGIPVKIMHPHIDFFLVDAVRKKISFISHVIRTLGLKDIRATHARVEDLAGEPDTAGTFDAVMARGFTRLDAFADLALPMLRPKGTIWALKGEGGPDEITPELQARFHVRTDEYELPFDKARRYLIRLVLKSSV
jgi:16S rRNA (guanine527-N7)-methyltransferase